MNHCCPVNIANEMKSTNYLISSNELIEDEKSRRYPSLRGALFYRALRQSPNHCHHFCLKNITKLSRLLQRLASLRYDEHLLSFMSQIRANSFKPLINTYREIRQKLTGQQ